MLLNNLVSMSLHLQPNIDWFKQSKASLMTGLFGTASSYQINKVAPAGFGISVDSTTLPVSLMSASNYLASPSDQTLLSSSVVVDIQQPITVTALPSDLSHDLACVGNVHTEQAITGINDTNIDLSIFNNKNNEFSGMGTYPHSRQSGLPPGKARTRLRWASPGTEDKGGTTVS